MQIFVRDNNVDQALRVLKKRMQREGIFREMKRQHPQKEHPPARPDARLRFSGPPRDKVRRESQSAHTPERIAVRGDRTHPIRPRTTSL